MRTSEIPEFDGQFDGNLFTGFVIATVQVTAGVFRLRRVSKDEMATGPQGLPGPTGPIGAIGPEGPEGPAGAGVPAGANTQLQFNDAGVFGGDAGLVYDKIFQNLTVGGTVVGGNLELTVGGAIFLGSLAGIWAPSSGVIRLTDNTATDVNRLNFGGDDASYPAIKRSGVNLNIRLADDSADTNLIVADEAYDAATWNGNFEVPTKNSIRDKMESLTPTAPTFGTVAYAASTAINFDGDDYQEVTLAGNITFTTSNLGAAKSVAVIIIADGSTRTFTFPATWKFVNASGVPASIVANKTAVLSLLSRTGADSGVIAAYAVQP